LLQNGVIALLIAHDVGRNDYWIVSKIGLVRWPSSSLG
jgi:hypothetical protein